MIEYFNEDCVQGMKQYPDKYFDLAVVDPPYGIGYDTQAVKSNGHKSGGRALKSVYHGTGWDDQPPNDEYFEQLFRVSKNQIIWGATTLSNYRLAVRLFAGTKGLKDLQDRLQIVNKPGVTANSGSLGCFAFTGTACCKAT